MCRVLVGGFWNEHFGMAQRSKNLPMWIHKFANVDPKICQGSLNGTHFGGIKQYKYVVISREFPKITMLCLGWKYNDPWRVS